jgi:superfamily II DNA or RNA helicase
MESFGYIYVRNHISYNNCCKLGKTNNVPERDTQYATGELNRGKFELVIEMAKNVIGIVEKMLQNYFNVLGFHIQHDGGTEFYKRCIINLIVPYLEKTNVKFKILSKYEIDNFVRSKRIQKLRTNKTLLTFVKNIKTIVQRPQQRPYQSLIIRDSIEYFQSHDKGMLVLICGVGKTLISLWIAQQLKTNTLIIGVPNLLLLKQWNKVVLELFPEIPILLVSDDVHTTDINCFLMKNKCRCVVITTYHSAHKVDSQITFDIKILDEVHHLTSKDKKLSGKKSFIEMLDIPAKKQLSLTATLKQLELDYDSDNVISNDDVKYFGEIIAQRNLLWAITNNIVCDYVIQTIIAHEDQLENQLKHFNITDENDKQLFLSAYVSLKSINDGHSHHLLIYSNNSKNSKKIINFIQLLLENKYFVFPNLYYSHYIGEMKPKDKNTIINRFKTSNQGIISCVYCLGEGWDLPLLDAVVFSENMTSNIRIVQSALRAIRKYIHDLLKKTKIILSIMNKDDWLENNDNTDLKKVKEVIYQMGLEDETIEYKIKVSRIEIIKQKPFVTDKFVKNLEDFGEYDEELTQKLRLKTIKRTALEMTYEKVRKILVDKNIKTKKAYLKLCEKDIRLSTDPERIFKGQFTNWIDFLSIERIYYDLETCKLKIIKYLNQNDKIKDNYLDLSKVCYELCKLDKNFPPDDLWIDYYNVNDLSNIINIVPKKKKITTDVI